MLAPTHITFGVTVQVVSLYEEGDANKDGFMTRDEHKVLLAENAESMSATMMELQTKFMLLMSEGRDKGEM